ncbi:MAG: DUF3472 domain-containing protein [Bacteroidota bacterium]
MKGEQVIKKMLRKRLRKEVISWILLLAMVNGAFYIISSCRESSEHPRIGELGTSIPLTGNSWVFHNIKQTGQLIRENGLCNWTDPKDTISTWFHATTTGEVHLGLVARVAEGSSRLSLSLNGKSRNLFLDKHFYDTLYVGKYHVDEVGYQRIDLTGFRRTGPFFAEVKELLIGGKVARGGVNFVRDDFYWGRRGPSVHLSYPVPEGSGDIRWFYNEITVPDGEDVLGSYFMANGFSHGYFGIQVNSETERRILFSVWSPFHTDDPREIPEDQRVLMLKKGVDVYTGEFGNEGSGGQSYLKYMWKAGETYGFLLNAEPLENNSTVFTAWFHDPEKGQWLLIASFQRPQTNNYLTRLHSFLENFYTESGATSRRVHYSNQWACNTEGHWIELSRARFTADATARKDARLDYSGGSKNEIFYLKNCGFTNDHTPIDEIFERLASDKAPQIDFKVLP